MLVKIYKPLVLVGDFVLGKAVTVVACDGGEVHVALDTMPRPDIGNYFMVEPIGMGHNTILQRFEAKFTIDCKTVTW